MQDIWHGCHDSGDDGDDGQGPVRPQIVVHFDRGRAQRARYEVARKSHETQGRGCVLEVDKHHVHVGRRKDADEAVAENS